MPEAKDKNREPIKVTDKRIFTSDGEIREEYRSTVTPVDPSQQPPPQPPQPPPAAEPDKTADSSQADRRKRIRDKGSNPGTPFTNFIESLIVNAYMSLGMLRNPYQPQTAVDLPAARQMIDIITMLSEKTKGNLTEDESEFLSAHLGELKLAYVQRSKQI
jgi:hypothetical protein